MMLFIMKKSKSYDVIYNSKINMQCILLYHAYDTMSSARCNHRPNPTNMSINQYKNACFHDYFRSGPDNGNNNMRDCEGGR